MLIAKKMIIRMYGLQLAVRAAKENANSLWSIGIPPHWGFKLGSICSCPLQGQPAWAQIGTDHSDDGDDYEHDDGHGYDDDGGDYDNGDDSDD